MVDQGFIACCDHWLILQNGIRGGGKHIRIISENPSLVLVVRACSTQSPPWVCTIEYYHAMGCSCSGREGPKTKSSWLAVGPVHQSSWRNILYLPCRRSHWMNNSLLCSVLTKSFASFARLRGLWFSTKRVLALLPAASGLHSWPAAALGAKRWIRGRRAAEWLWPKSPAAKLICSSGKVSGVTHFLLTHR